MRKTWVAVLTFLLSACTAAVHAEDALGLRLHDRLLAALHPYDKAEAPAPAPAEHGTPAPPSAAPHPADHPEPAAPGDGGCAGGCGTCGHQADCPSCGKGCLERLCGFFTYRPVCRCRCYDCGNNCCCCRWVPLYLYFLKPCVEGDGHTGCGVCGSAGCDGCGHSGVDPWERRNLIPPTPYCYGGR
jgi:hypothetical protein